MRRIVVAIDGPAGAGKSTIAKKVANRICYIYIDTGAMYRALTWQVLQKGISPADEKAICKLANETVISFKKEHEEDQVYVDNLNITKEIRLESVSQNVSQIASYACVRKRLVEQQRNLALQGGVIMDGRDIGTVVLPDAELKIYLTASIQKRAERRAKQLAQLHPDVVISLREITEGIRKRDKMDQNRKESPLRQAANAILVDNSEWTLEETEKHIEMLIKKVAEHVS